MDSIHPNLKKESFLIRFGLIIFFVTAILPLVIALIILQATLSFDFIRTVSILLGVLIMSAISMLIFIRFFGKYKEKVQKASALLYHNKPEKGIIQPEVHNSIWGPIFRILKEDGGIELIALKVQKNGIKKMYSQPVEIYRGTKTTDNTAVVKVHNSYMISKLLTHKKSDDITQDFKNFRRGFIIIISTIIVVLIISQILTYFNIKSDAEFAVKTKSWPTISGTILSSKINEVQVKQGKTHVKGYEAAINYKYNLNGKDYLSNSIHLAYEAGTNYDYAKYYVDKYPAGSTQFVYYNPDDYSFALLEAGHEAEILAEGEKVYIVIGLIAGILIVVMITLLFLFKYQEKAARRFFGVKVS